MIFVSDGVLINGEEIIKRDSREIVCSRRVTIKIENWVDPEARWKVKSIEHVSLILVSDQTDIFTPLSLSSSALIRKCSSLQVVREREEMGCVLYMHLHANRESVSVVRTFGNRISRLANISGELVYLDLVALVFGTTAI